MQNKSNSAKFKLINSKKKIFFFFGVNEKGISGVLTPPFQGQWVTHWLHRWNDKELDPRSQQQTPGFKNRHHMVLQRLDFAYVMTRTWDLIEAKVLSRPSLPPSHHSGKKKIKIFSISNWSIEAFTPNGHFRVPLLKYALLNLFINLNKIWNSLLFPSPIILPLIKFGEIFH